MKRWNSIAILFAFSVLYLPYVCARALVKPLWFDELATVLVSRQGSVGEIYRVLNAGVDAQPPLSFLLTHWSLMLPGNELVTARLPSVFGFWLMSMCLYAFAARRGTQMGAVLAMLIPFVSGLLYYATEARPYALVLGFSALALLAWQAIPESRRPWVMRAVMFLSLAAGIYSHYYAVLIPCALLAGQAARSLRTRKVDWWTLFSLAGSYLAFLALRPMLAAQTARLGVHWAHPALQSVLEFYQTALDPLVLPMLFVVVAVAIYQKWRGASDARPAELPFEELVAAAAYFFIPVGAYLVGVFVSHSYTGRYSIASLIGIAILLWWLLNHYFRNAAGAVWIATGLILALVGVDELRSIRRAFRGDWKTEVHDLYPFRFPGNLPVMVQDGRDFLPMVYYAEGNLASRFSYVADPAQAMKYTGSLGLDVVLIDFKRCTPLRVDNYRDFVSKHQKFLLFWGKPEIGALSGWQLDKLKADGAAFRVVEESGLRVLFEVDMSGAGKGASPQVGG